MIVQQFGLPRTGTNVIKALIETNLRDTHVLSAGKHHDVDESRAEDCDRFVVSVKDPVSWVVSYHRYQSRVAHSEEPPRRIDPVEHLVDGRLALWAVRTSSHLRLADERPEGVAVVQHEAILRDPLETLDSVRSRLGFDWVSDERELFLDGYARRAGWHEHGAQLIDREKTFDRDFHLSGAWASEAPDDVLAKCRRFMDGFFESRPDWAAYFDLSHLAEIGWQ